MSYVVVSTQVRLETGPTLCGDEDSNPILMGKLDAALQVDSGMKFQLYLSPHPPRVILDRLAGEGYRVVACCGVGQSCVWTLFKS